MSLVNDFKKTNYPGCDKFVPENNVCCGDEETNLNYYNPLCLSEKRNKKSNKQELTKLIFTTLKYSRTIYSIANAIKLARKYYNQNKDFCVSINMGAIEGGSGKLTLYLNQNCTIDNTNLNHLTFLTRIIKGLPTLWGCNNFSSNPLSFCNKGRLVGLQKNEKILMYYMRHSDFFVNLLYALKNSIYTYAKHKNYCKVFNVPKYLSPYKESYKVSLSGKEMKMLYCMYLRHSSGSSYTRLPFSGN